MAKFTQQHYLITATVLSIRYGDPVTDAVLNQVAVDFARFFAKDSPRFDPVAFFVSCRRSEPPTAQGVRDLIDLWALHVAGEG